MNIISKVACSLVEDEQRNIIDIGCNRGYTLIEIKDNFRQLVGIDCSEKALAVAMKEAKSKNIHFLLARAEELPVRSGTFRIAICAETIEHVSSEDKVLDEINRILEDRGKLLITFPVWHTEKIISFFNKDFMSYSGHVKSFSLAKIQQLLNKHCFKIIKKNRYYFEWALLYTLEAIFSKKFSGCNGRLRSYEPSAMPDNWDKLEFLTKRVIKFLESIFIGRIILAALNFLYPKTYIFLCEKEP